MAEQNLRKLNRTELLEMLLEVSKENERQREEIEYLNHLLNDRRIVIQRAGTIAEAAFEMNQVLQAAQDAADQYLNNVRILAEQQERELAEKRVIMEKELGDKRVALEQETWDRCRAIERDMVAKCQQEKEKTRRECEQMRLKAEAEGKQVQEE